MSAYRLRDEAQSFAPLCAIREVLYENLFNKMPRGMLVQDV
jgi:hypothetical protein